MRLDVDALTELGLFRFAPDRKRAIELAHEQGYAFAGETRRLYHADALSRNVCLRRTASRPASTWRVSTRMAGCLPVDPTTIYTSRS